MKQVIGILVNILFTLSLSGQSGNRSQVKNINLTEAFSHPQEVQLSRFVSKISYIPLETNTETLIPEAAKFEVTDEFIIVRTSDGGIRHILLFNRNTGKFIREIGKQGRGPGEFLIYSTVPFNPVKKEIYALSYSRELLVYDLSGRNIDKIKLPQWSDSGVQDGRLIDYPVHDMLDENIFVGHILNFSGQDKRKLVLLTKEEVLKIFPNYLTYNGRLGVRNYQFIAKFYKWNNNLYFIIISMIQLILIIF